MTCVRVAEHRQVVHDGTVYLDGQTVEVPADVAEHWTEHGWASVVEDKPRSKRG